LVPCDYRISGNTVRASWGRIDITGIDFEISIAEGQESLYYWQKQPINVLIIRAGKGTKKMTARFQFN